MGTPDERENLGQTGKIDNELFAKLAAEKRKKIEDLLRGSEIPQTTGRVNKDLIRFGITEEIDQKNQPISASPDPAKTAGTITRENPVILTKTQKAQELGLIPPTWKDDSLTEELKVYDGTLPLGADIQPAEEPIRVKKNDTAPLDFTLENQIALGEEPPAEPVQQVAATHFPSEPLEQSLDTHELLRMARKEKISNFVLSALEIADENETEAVPTEDKNEEEQGEEPFEYTPSSDAGEIEQILKNGRGRKKIQIFFTFLLTLVSLGVLFADKLPVSMFRLTGDETTDSIQMMLQTGVLLFIALVAFLVNIDAMGDGARNFIRLNASQESGALVVWIACIIQGVLTATDTSVLKSLVPDANGLQGAIYGLYIPIAVLSILLAQIGAYLRQSRELLNFKTLRGSGEMQHLRLQNIGDSTLMERPKGEADCAVALYVPAEFSSGFFAMSDTEDMADRTNRVAVPLVMAIAFLVGLVAWLTDSAHRPIFFVTAFAAVNASVMPAASAILACLPQSRAARVNMKKGVVISNQCAFDDAAAATSLVLSDEELFPVGSVLLHGIKTFNGKRMDEAIVIAASAVDKHSGPLKHMFAGILAENEENCLLEVDTEAVYEPERGLISWILGKRVLIGSRDFMLEYQISLPEKEYETRFMKKGYTLLYLALGGELMAMFVVSYHVPEEMVDSLRSLTRKRVKLLIDTKDSGISGKLVARQLRIPASSVVVMNMDGKKAAERLTAKATALKTGVACRGGAAEKAEALSACFKLRRMVTAGFVLEAGFLIVALLINVLFVLFGNYSRINLPFILAYQLIWLAASVVLQLFARYKNP